MIDHDNLDQDFGSLLAAFEKEAPEGRKLRSVRVGQQVQGRVVNIGQEAVFVDLGGKSEGMLAIEEVRDADGKLLVKVGDVVEARVVESGGKSGCVVLRRSALGHGPEARAELEQAHAHGIPVEGVVTAVNKGGVDVQVAGVRAFCPISQLDLRHVENAATFVGQKLSFLITRMEPGRGRDLNIVVSRRTLLEQEARAKADKVRAQLKPGAVLRGTVTSVREYGAFVDLGGVEGMLHVSEIGFQRVSSPAEVLSVGQELEVQILRIEKTDDPRKPDRIALSLKALARDPWDDVAQRFPEGGRLRGTVARVEPFGAFVELVPGVEGLVHISELGGGKRVTHARDVVRPGQGIDVQVLAVDREKRRIALTLASEEDRESPSLPSPATVGRQSLGTLADLLSGGGKKKR